MQHNSGQELVLFCNPQPFNAISGVDQEGYPKIIPSGIVRINSKSLLVLCHRLLMSQKNELQYYIFFRGRMNEWKNPVIMLGFFGRKTPSLTYRTSSIEKNA